MKRTDGEVETVDIFEAGHGVRHLKIIQLQAGIDLDAVTVGRA
ncbi:hypothetical protein SDC9_138440 [bioreactor metagenome]|uniref:Uncharacterized protein n=1 Tax=bioreactor metagenome TaxID=1076179 RepID=A0A645DS75_9ZZZZ